MTAKSVAAVVRGGAPSPFAARTAIVYGGLLAVAACLSATAATASPAKAAASEAGGDELDGQRCAAAAAAGCDGVRKRTVCASDGRAYASVCELQRLSRCEGRSPTVVDCASQTRQPSPAARVEDGCIASLRKEFTANFLKHVQEEYDRLAPETRSPAGSTKSEKAVNWKFDGLDLDGSDALSAAEMRQLKKLVRNNLQPRACSKDLTETCDSDRDADISRLEWSACFGLRTSASSAPREEMQADMQSSDGRPRTTATSDEALDIVDEPGLEPSLPVGRRTSAAFLLPGNGLPPGDAPTNQQRRHRDGLDGARRRSNGDDLVSIAVRTCVDARESVLRNPGNGMIPKLVPVCQKNGKFKREQCLPQGLICWCADEDSGSPVVGSMVKSGMSRLNCSDSSTTAKSGGGAGAGKVGVNEDAMSGNPPHSSSGSQPTREREFPGCANKKSFLTELVSAFTREMASFGRSSTHNADSSLTAAEKALHWKVTQSDRNNDQRLSAPEARELVKPLTGANSRLSKQQLSRCAGGLLVYCDTSGDKHLTYSELADCLELRAPLSPSASEHSSTLGRPGWPKLPLPNALDLNPFVHLLVPWQRDE